MVSNVLLSCIRWGYIPFLFVGVNGLGIYIIFSDIAPLERMIGVFAVVALALTVSFKCERLLPYNKHWNKSRGDGWRDVIHFAFNESLSLGPTLIAPVFIAVAVESQSGSWPTHWPLLAQLLIAILLFDLIQNLVHWLAHVWPPLWRFHAVHHEVKRLYGFNGILKHPLYQIFSSMAGTLPLVALGMPKDFLLVLGFCSLVQLLIQHSNVDFRTGPIKYILSTAEVHRYHHLRGKSGDVNFAMFFSFWDHMFGNAYDGQRKLESADVGVDYIDYPASWFQQMLAPFKRWNKIDSSIDVKQRDNIRENAYQDQPSIKETVI